MAVPFLSYSELRQRIAAAIAAIPVVDGVPPWKQSPYAYDDFARVPDSFAEQVFAVGLPSSDDAGIDRQHVRKLAQGTQVVTDLRVSFIRRLRTSSTDAVTDTDTGLDAEDVVRKAVMGAASRESLHLRYVGTPVRSAGGGWLRVELRFEALHRIPLE